MSSIAHTAGPWHIFEPIDRGAHCSIGSWLPGNDTRHLIASVWTVNEDDNGRIKNDAETEANARLIAASPDLLEACKQLVNVYENGYPESDHARDVVNTARAAIALAEQPK